MDHWLFVHVMKTAGTSFRTLLEQSFDAEIYPTRAELAAEKNQWYVHAPELIARAADGRIDLAARRVVCGHYAANLRDHLPGAWRAAVFLREPVARTVSIIGHRRRQAGFLKRHLGRWGVADMLKNDVFVRQQVADYQTKVFAMDGLQNVNRGLAINRDGFARAVANLRRTEFVGLTEAFRDSMALFEKTAGMGFRQEELHANRAKSHKAETPEEDLAAIRALVPYDIELYAIARELLAERIKAAA